MAHTSSPPDTQGHLHTAASIILLEEDGTTRVAGTGAARFTTRMAYRKELEPGAGLHRRRPGPRQQLSDAGSVGGGHTDVTKTSRSLGEAVIVARPYSRLDRIHLTA